MSGRQVVVVAITLCSVGGALAGASFVPGFVPDWNQPYTYTPASAWGGPGPDPRPGQLDPWNAWCAPTSGSNLAGHWNDTYLNPVADGVAFPNSAVMWAAGASWQDYLADGFARPAAGGGLPPVTTDIGYYMDTNFNGMLIPGNVAHAGTYLKDIHLGLGSFLGSLQANTFTTGTQGRGFAAGLKPDGVTPAGMHANAAAAFAELKGEIDAGHTIIVSWTNWNIGPAGFNPLPGGGQGEGSFDTDFYDFSGSGPDPWNNDEQWNYDDGGTGLGHAVTAVGYLLANDPLNPQQGTDWVIVHDNVLQTPRNVAVPMNFNVWVANTNAVPEPASLVLLGLGAFITLRRRR